MLRCPVLSTSSFLNNCNEPGKGGSTPYIGLERRKEKGETVVCFTICPIVDFNPFALFHKAHFLSKLA
jgi:hypothetical protein